MTAVKAQEIYSVLLTGSPVNTRFNPTVNGALHLGHLYLALVNEHEAHRTGGKFIVRFDDNQPDWFAFLGYEKIKQLKDKIRNEISLFCHVDEWISQLDDYRSPMPHLIDLPNMPEVPSQNGRFVPVYDRTTIPDWRPEPGLIMYPYAPHFTAEKVWLDYLEDINWLIRGVDLTTEFTLYEYICEMAKLPKVRHTYMPRLRRLVGRDALPLSKTGKGITIREAVDKLGVSGTENILREGCLIDPDGEWTVENVREEPVIVI